MRRLLRRHAVDVVVLSTVGAWVLLVLVLFGHPALAAAPEPAWTWPLGEPAAVARPFDAPEHRYAAGHRGADLAGAPGAPVLAAGAGRVSYAGLLAGRGVVVVVHGPLRTTYEPVAAGVVVGQSVAAGEVLGRLEPGHAGCSAAACLHWGLRRGDDYLDPVQLVDPGPARLLPVEGGAGAGAGGAGAVAAEGQVVPPAPAEAAPGPTRRALPAPAGSTPTEPHWSLRAAEAPAGAAAVVALAAGLALLARPRRPPDGPVGQAPAGPVGLAAPAADDLALSAPVDLDGERARRRTAS